ncbi:argininosuccinate lyase [Bacillus sp. APMAM]|nr:argininosuccinate lyase [Bacillus sp. APMAM]RTZ57557.1 argininosuccinate lyase [Bacillus sp. SAJ1]
MHRIEKIMKQEGCKFPGITYSEVVLEPAFENAKKQLLEPMLEVNRAHLIMLVEQNLLSQEEGATILDAISQIDIETIKNTSYAGEYEDLFFLIESEIIRHAGEIGGSLHLARSRNDLGVAIYRMTLRQHILQTIQSAQNFQQTLLDVAEEHLDTLMLGYTHTQQAQPMTFAHYLLAVYDIVNRDVKRLLNAYKTCNKSPLGAAALTTTGFPINRYRVAELLGFDGLVENSYDAIAGADYLCEAACTIKVALINLGRVAQDLLLWSTQEFSAISVADPYVQISSIMPQKRNPVSLEHIRALSSSGVGDAETVLQMIHNTPFGDINDTEDDLQPFIWKCHKTAKDVYALSTVVIGTLKVNKNTLYKRAKESFATITELADALTREVKIPFRSSHAIASKLVRICMNRKLLPSQISDKHLEEAAIHILGKPLHLSNQFVENAMNPVQFIQKRSQPGGPAPTEVKRMIKNRKNNIIAQVLETKTLFDKLSSCSESLHEITNKWTKTD